MARSRLYRGGSLIREDFPVQEISDHLADPATLIWLDLLHPSAEKLARVGQEFGLHELALEDAAKAGQRPKLDRYRAHEFFSGYAVTVEPGGGLRTTEIAAFITGQALITVRQDDAFDIDDVVARWDDSPDLADQGVGFLLHGLLDHLVDGHFQAVQQMDDAIEELEELLFAEDPGRIRQVQRDAYELRKSLVGLRRVVLPMREVVNTLMRPGLGVVTGPLMPYYQDIYDHVLRAAEWTESLRDMVASVMETNLSVQSNRMNLIMKKVTSWAAIIAVPTAITGFYGQNVPYPGFSDHFGLITSSTLIVGITVLLFVLFRRNDWL
ncbi:magnesium transporter CorA family protein [Streptomyces xiamenensis]|jgi:magnesium transporter|uniref:magnesium transporter CorA family protein n=1 Tax=Streptomyces TaxID=1883 RepID=UPI001906953F|nr:magnesium transporter CorA family protein [Streptomyces sp. XC 2026]QQN76791.1 magnesium transporter CorA family protein [Streptomyces sp. XC 2026]